MKIIVFSDSHGHAENMEKALDSHQDAKYCFHLGDGTHEFEKLDSYYPDICFVSVSGNFEDFFSNKKTSSTTLEIEGFRFFLCHGHRFSVKSSLSKLEYYSAENNIDVALFGHTHTPCSEYTTLFEKPFYLFNPGSITLPNHSTPSYGVIEIQNKNILLSHGYID